MSLIYWFYPFRRPVRHFVKKTDPKEEALAKLKNKAPVTEKVRIVWLQQPRLKSKFIKCICMLWLHCVQHPHFFHLSIFLILAENVGASSAISSRDSLPTALSSRPPRHLHEHEGETALPGGPVRLAAPPATSPFSPWLPTSSSSGTSTHPSENPWAATHGCSVPQWVSHHIPLTLCLHEYMKWVVQCEEVHVSPWLSSAV